MKKLLLFVGLLTGLISNSQVKTNYSQYGGNWQRLTMRSIQLPRMQLGVKDLNLGYDTAQIYYNPVDSSIYTYTGTQWILLRGSGSGGSGVTNIATGLWLSGGPITSSGTIILDSAGVATYFMRRKDSSVNGGYYPFATNPKNYLLAADVAAGYVPLARTLTINGVNQDLNANRTYNVGTVTSIGLVVPAAFSASAAITGSGNVTVTAIGTSGQYIRGDGQLATYAGGSGTVNSGTQYRIAYYATTGTALSEAPAITALRALISDANGVPTHSVTTSTELSYVNGVTSAIQTQIDGKANRALSNLASVSINATLVPQTTLDLGATATPWQYLYLYGSGAYGSTSMRFGGTPTGNRFYTFPDATTTIVGTDVVQTLTNKTITSATNTLGGVTMTLGSDANGDTYYRSGGVLTRLGIGSANQLLRVNAGGTAPEYFTPTFISLTGLSATTPLTYNNGTGVFGLAGLTTLGSANQIVGMNNAGTGYEYKTVSTSGTAISNDVGVTLSGANALVINLPSSSATVRGVLTAADWTLFNSKLTGSLASGNIFVGNVGGFATSVTPTGDLAMDNVGVFTFNTVNSNVGTFGGTGSYPVFTVNGKGLITAASSHTIVAGDIPDLSGTYANRALSNLSSVAINTSLLPGTTGIALGSSGFPFSTLFLNSGIGSNNTQLSSGEIGTNRIITLPNASTTLIGTNNTATVTNKILTGSTNVLGGNTMTLGSDADGDTYYRASSVLTRVAKGTAGQVYTMNAGATAPEWAASTVAWNAISNPAGTQSLTFDDGELNAWTVNSNTETFHTINANSLTTGIVEKISSSSLTSGKLLFLTSTSTALSGFNNLFTIGASGVNSNNGTTVTGAYIEVVNTNATSGTNTALSLLANAAIDANHALDIVAGDIYIRGTSSGAATIQQVAAQGTPAFWFPTNGGEITAKFFTTGTTQLVSSGSARFNNANATALNSNSTVAAPSGTYLDNNEIILRIKDDGTPRTLGWNAIYRASTGLPLPVTTTANKTMYLHFIYNSADNKWDLVDYLDNF